MTATLVGLRLVNCFSCGRPTGERTPDGQSEWPCCRNCENLASPHGSFRYNVPQDRTTLYCDDQYRRDRFIREHGNGLIPYVNEHTGNGVAEDGEREDNTGVYACQNCGSTRFRFNRREIHTCVTDQADLDEEDQYPDRPLVYTDTEYDDTEDTWVVCDNCGEYPDGYDTD